MRLDDAGAARMGQVGACLRPGGLELTDRIVVLARLPRSARVLDVGCGVGATVTHLADRHGLRPVGIDASPAQIARARAARPDLDIVAGRAEALPFAAGAFDAVLAECVLSTLPDAGLGLREMIRVLSAGGCIVLTDLYDRDGDGAARSRSGLPSLGPRRAVEALLAGAGLEAETWEDHTGALARLLWDMAVPAPAGQGRVAAPAPERPAGRNLGYFACVARARPVGGHANDERNGDERERSAR
jgi:SAM-dependent methyltransferase